MTAWLQSIDIALLHFVNQTLSNSVFDVVMPFVSGQGWMGSFLLAALAAALCLLWKGGVRGRLCALMLALILWPGDSLVCNTIKHAVLRPRPPGVVADVRLPGRQEKNFAASGAVMGDEVLIARPGAVAVSYTSMPSSHAANWFAATMILLIYYRRSWRFMVPMACLVAASRVYLGVHYPSDVLAGGILGAGYSAAGVWALDALWQWAGRKWFPLWWEKVPSLVSPEKRGPIQAAGSSRTSTLDQHWLRFGYLFIAALLLFHLGYIASDTITLSKDEAYQWLWSKHLALSYYSKPPGIAFIQFAGTSLWGDTQFGVRFFSPVFAAILSLVLLRFMARETSARLGCLLLLIVSCVPLLGLGAILMTIDPPLVLCWTLAMVIGWRAIQQDGTTKQWLLVGMALGGGFLCKYSAAYQIVCWALFFALWAPARMHLKKPGPYLSLLVFALCTLPVLVWNLRNHWITVTHVASNAGLDSPWKPTLRYFWDFLFAEGGLLNPVFLIGAVWAMVAFWKRRREHPLWLYFFCMGAPVFLGHWLYSFHSRILPNWIAPAALPMFCLMVAYWDTRWREGARAVKGWLAVGLLLGLVAMVAMHESNLVGKVVGRPLPAEKDPLRRVRAWKETTAVVEQARQKLLQEGKPAFIICDHYGMAGLFSFYLPEARAALHNTPLVYYQTSPEPDNQFYFWPEYRYRGQRQGENAIYVTEQDPYPLENVWPWRWLTGKEVRHARQLPPIAAPPLLFQEFKSVTDLGVHEIKLGDRVFRRVQLFECRNLQCTMAAPGT
jgi:4-amino-4-deoxy-L-arabinose transferase-like glycosyltransferase/membrane-associated phospholipid phosphatase